MNRSLIAPVALALAGAGLVVAYLVVEPSRSSEWFAVAVPALAAVWILIAVAVNRPMRPIPWVLLAIAGEPAHLLDFEAGLRIERTVEAAARSFRDGRWTTI